MSPASAFGAVLRELRRERGMSQEALAETSNFDPTYPSLLERGLRTPTLTSVFRLADALGVAPSEIVERTHVRLQAPSGGIASSEYGRDRDGRRGQVPLEYSLVRITTHSCGLIRSPRVYLLGRGDEAVMLRISVLLSDEDEARFSAYCRERGFKKSTLIARLIREHLDREGYGEQVQLGLLPSEREPPGGSQDQGSKS